MVKKLRHTEFNVRDEIINGGTHDLNTFSRLILNSEIK